MEDPKGHVVGHLSFGYLRIPFHSIEGNFIMPDPDNPPPMDETQELLQFFDYSHLKDELQTVSRPFCDIAKWVVDNIPRNRERTVALRKLLEAKDAAVRAKLSKRSPA